MTDAHEVTAAQILREAHAAASQLPQTATTATTWEPIDLSAILAGTHKPTEPFLGCRSDGQALLYPGKIHSVAGETEAGKSWLALLWVTEQLLLGNTVIYVDFEDDEVSVTSRLLALGVPRQPLLDHFAYVRPQSFHHEAARLLIPEGSFCELVVIDGVTELMTMQGLRTTDDGDVAEMLLLPRALAATGAAVVLIDHVVKDRQSRGRFATGSQHKLSGITGAAYILECDEPFAMGKSGRSTLFLAKDRPGAIRGKTTKVGSTKFAVAQLHVKAVEDSSDIALSPYQATSRRVWDPTAKMQHVSEVLEDASPDALSYNQIKLSVGGKSEICRQAVDALIRDGYVATAPGAGRAQLHTLIKPYRAPTEQSSSFS